jgi:hypothetical protein
MPHTREQTITALLEQDTSLRPWLEQMRALTKDGHGGTLIAGLTGEETEEFLRLNSRVQAYESGMTGPEFQAARERHAELRGRIEDALQDNAIESLSGWDDAAAAR